MIMDALLQDPALPGAPHILLVSIPPPGHLFPFTSFAYQLAAAGAQVTCFTTGYVFEHLQHRGDNKYRDESSSGSCSKSSRVRFEGLFDYEEIHEIGMDDVMGWLQAFSNEKMEAVLERRFLELQPRPVCIVADMFLGWVQDVANKMHVPRHTLFTMNAKELAFLIRIPQLFESGELPGLNADGVMKSDISMPGMAPLPVEGVWGVFKDETVGHHQQVKEAFRRLPESKSIILNTFEELEAETLEALRTDYVAANIKVPELLPILLSSIPRLQRPNATNGNDQVSEVEKWLDTQAPASVIYISFGSLATLTKQQTGALALALEATNYPFIWVYRPPGISQVSRQSKVSISANHETSYEYFPPRFQDRVGGRAMLINGWAPQPQILTHHAIGAFLTHCGWNSTLESVCAGVPMLCWPFFADQNMNARFVTDTIQAGLRMKWGRSDDTVDQDEIQKVLTQMMDGEEGKAARSSALKFRLLAQADVADGGASNSNLHKILLECTSASLCNGSYGC